MQSSRPETRASDANSSSVTRAAATSCCASTRPGLSSARMSRRAGYWIALLRLALVGIAVVDVALTKPPGGYGACAWIVTACFAVPAAGAALLTRFPLSRDARVSARIGIVAADAVVVIGYI